MSSWTDKTGLSSKQLSAVFISLMVILASVLQPELATQFLNFGEKMSEDDVIGVIRDYIDQGLGGSPYITEKVHSYLISSINISGTMYYYALNGTSGLMEFHGTVPATVLQAAIDAVEAGPFERGSIHLDSGFYCDGEVQITESVSLYGSTRHYIDATLFYPHISRLVVNSTGGSIRGIVIQGLSMFTLWFDQESNGIHAASVLDCHIDMRNATCYGLVWEGDGGLGSGESYNFVMRDSRISYDATVGTGGYDWGAITLIDVDQGTGHYWYDNLHVTLRTSNSTVHVVRGESIADKSYFINPEFYVDPNANDTRIFYQQKRHVDQGSQGARIQVFGGRLEARNNVTVVELDPASSLWPFVCYAFYGFDVAPESTNDKVTLYNSYGQTNVMANSFLVFDVVPGLGNGIIEFGDMSNNGNLWIVLNDIMDNVTKDQGVATIPNGQPSVQVTHGLGLTPNVVWATGSTNDTRGLFITTITATTFNITAPANVGGARTVYWLAEFDPNDFW